MSTIASSRIVQVDNLSVDFRSNGRVVQAVRDVSFHVDRGETLAIVASPGRANRLPRWR